MYHINEHKRCTEIFRCSRAEFSTKILDRYFAIFGYHVFFSNFLLGTKIILILEVHGEKVALFILFNDSPCFPESTTPRKKFEINIWYPKMAKKKVENFRWEFREHRKISVGRVCSFGIYYLISSARASSIFEKSLYL